jgi:hypothetical protein
MKLGTITNSKASNNKKIQTLKKIPPTDFEDNIMLTNNLHSLNIKILDYQVSYNKNSILIGEIDSTIDDIVANK